MGDSFFDSMCIMFLAFLECVSYAAVSHAYNHAFCMCLMFMYTGKTFVVSFPGNIVRRCPLLVHVYKTARWCSTCRCFGFMQQFINDTCYVVACIGSGKYQCYFREREPN